MQSSQPPASNMRELVWDDELEMIAQRSAFLFLIGIKYPDK
jgi:hypothetical protein